VTSTREDFVEGYDLSNEFFRLWLDERMHYTSAVFDERHTTLEDAQRNKNRILADFAGVTADTLVLDIGCGWGATLEYLARERRVKRAHGITLSRAQHEEIAGRKLEGVETWCVDYKDFVPHSRYDALISIEMVDHLVSPAQQRQGLAVDIYREYFNRVAGWAVARARFGLQAILRDRVPRRRVDLENLKFTAEVMFPGGLNPRLEELVAACGQSWEILSLVTRREDYGKTTAEWLRRLRGNERQIMDRGSGGRVMKNGETVWRNYERFLSTCMTAFDQSWASLVQMELRKKPAA
jgi:cyclopropane-fatty-acyl-phospholipid synthase